MSHLEGLTDEQFAAIKSSSSQLFVSAGPGSGKTRVLTTRIFDQIILRMIDDFENKKEAPLFYHYFPASWVITFTNKAAQELKERVEKLLQQYFTSKSSSQELSTSHKRLKVLIKKAIYVGTFHSLGYQLLQRFGRFFLKIAQFSILDVKDSRAIIRLIAKQLKDELSKATAPPFPASTLDKLKPQDVLNVINSHKQSYRHPSHAHLPLEDPWSLYDIAHFSKVAKNMGHSFQAELRLYEELYRRYISHMRQSKQLDFNDMLQWAIHLIHRIPPPVTREFVKDSCPSLLLFNLYVDEFQDTNRLQLEFLTTVYRYCQQIPSHSLSVTLVGDPDQTIFSWRNFAPVYLNDNEGNSNEPQGLVNSTNANNLDTQYSVWKAPSIFSDDPAAPFKASNWDVILLSANFRSVQAITRISKQIIDCDTSHKDRITIQTLDPQTFQASAPSALLQADKVIREEGPRVFLGKQRNGAAEIRFIVSEILRLKDSAISDGVNLKYSDFAILMRASYLSKDIQKELTSAGIPCSGLGGPGLWDGKSVRDILTYFRLLRNPSDVTALLRAVNVPPRKIGSTTLARLSAYLGRSELPAVDALSTLIKEKKKDHPDDAKICGNAGLKQFVSLFDKIRESISSKKEDSKSPNLVELYDTILEYTDYGSHLLKCAQDNTVDRYGSDEDEDKPTVFDPLKPLHGFRQLVNKICYTLVHEDEELSPTPDSETTELFVLPPELLASIDSLLEAAGLGVSAEDVGAKVELPDVVRISTFHSSKGLEWPIVFILDAKQGSIPHRLSHKREEIDEEARVLYVGVTRTKYMLYITWPSTYHSNWSGTQNQEPSCFLTSIPKKLITASTPTLDSKFWSQFCSTVGNITHSPKTEVVTSQSSFSPATMPQQHDNSYSDTSYKPVPIKKETGGYPGFVSASSMYNIPIKKENGKTSTIASSSSKRTKLGHTTSTSSHAHNTREL